MTTPHQFDMTDDEVKLAHEAGRLATRHLSGIKLEEGLKIGVTLMVGRTAAMKAARVNFPRGRTYTEAFSEWKRMFKSPKGRRLRISTIKPSSALSIARLPRTFLRT